MSKKRNIGEEILQGVRKLKRGEHGRVTVYPDVAVIIQKNLWTISTVPTRHWQTGAGVDFERLR